MVALCARESRVCVCAYRMGQLGGGEAQIAEVVREGGARAVDEHPAKRVAPLAAVRAHAVPVELLRREVRLELR